MLTPPTPTTGEIYLLNVPFDSNYRNVIDFKTELERFKYFTKYYGCKYHEAGQQPIKFYYDDCSYTRKDGVLYVPVHIDKLYDCNYVMFRNSYISGKWFYCFVMSQKYINEGCTALTITTDVYSTWGNNMVWQPSFVEREHLSVTEDIPGANLAPEGLETGEFVPYEVIRDENLMAAISPEVCVAFNYNTVGSAALSYPNGGTYNGIPSSVPFLLIRPGHITQFINAVNAAQQGAYIFTVFTVPHAAVSTIAWESGDTSSYKEILTTSSSYSAPENVVFTTYRPDNINGYTPHNKKLLTYPYCYLGFVAPNGTPKIYRYENFNNPGEIKFTAISEINPNPTLVLNPRQYNVDLPNVISAVTINGYPLISYTNDVFNTWLAQNSQMVNLSLDRSQFNYDMSMARNNIAVNRENANATANLIGNAVSAATATMSGNIPGMIGGTVGGILGEATHAMNLQDLALSNLANEGNRMYDIRSINAQIEKQSMLPDVGTLSSSNSTLLGYGYFWQATFARFGIKPDYLKRIDDFFDMYGYQTNEVKIPNTNNRTYWNYVKTVGANIRGAIPEKDMNILKSIFDNGVTIWHKPNLIYSYAQRNWEVTENE